MLPPESRAAIISQIRTAEGVSPIPCASDSLLIRTDFGGKYVLHREKPIEKLREIVAEYDGIGYTSDYSGSLGLRTIDEQETFLAKCIKSGLPVLPSVARIEEGLIFPFIEGVTYSEFLSTETSAERIDHVVSAYMRDLLTAHSQAIVYGDRWGPNTIINPENSIQHIDLDLELKGPFAREFELAQGVYYTIFFAGTRDKKELVIDIINGVLRNIQSDPNYNRIAFINLLKAHMTFFSGKDYECPETAILLS